MLFSVITINYNNREGLRNTIKSVVGQTYKDFEYIVIDGGSIDGSKELLEENASSVTYWISEKDNGIYHAMNKGVARASGTYCVFMNSGDFFCSKDVLERVAALGFKDDIMSQKTVYDDATAAEADYTLTEDKAYVGHYKYVYSLFQDSSENQYAISNDDYESFGSYYVFNITDKKITIGDKELTYLEYNPDVLYSSLEGVPELEERDEWDHYVGGTELIIDRTKKTTNNPKTSDDAINYIVITIISSLGLIYTLRKEN